MYGNNFFNPYAYQPSYHASNLASGLARNSTNLAGGLTRNSALANTTLGGLGRGSGLGLGNLLKNFSFSGFLNGASKTLNVINQAIPVFYQVKPIFNNAKTMFRIMGAVKDDKPANKQTTQNIFSNTKSNQSTTNIKPQSRSVTIQNKNDFEEENPTFFI